MWKSLPDRSGRRMACGRRTLKDALLRFLLLFLGATSLGCVSVSNPLANGIPVRRLPPELLAEPRGDKRPIPLTLLRQDRPDAYRYDTGDVLGIWIEGIIGDRNQVPPVNFPQQGDLEPAVGFPFPVREDGTISLPLVDPVKVAGLTQQEATAEVRFAYTKRKQLLVEGRDRIIVTLLRRRESRVLVVRQEAGGGAGSGGSASTAGGRNVSFSFGAISNAGTAGRSQGYAVDLPAYENDVLNALVKTGGLPGFESIDEVIIERGGYAVGRDKDRLAAEVEQRYQKRSNWHKGTPVSALEGEITVIPLRMRANEPIPFSPRDILLQTGDVVYVRAREADLYYTGGLLPPGEYSLPRDYDLDVVKAVLRIGGPIVTSFNANNINGGVTGSGVGSPTPSLLTVLRQTPGGGQVPIVVDLNRALRDPRENISVQAGDILILQERPSEGMTRYFTQSFFDFTLVSRIISGNKTNGTILINAP